MKSDVFIFVGFLGLVITVLGSMYVKLYKLIVIITFKILNV